jgi:hypothetical protein
MKFPYIANFCIAVLLLMALPFLLRNESRPIISQESILTSGRTKLYFKNYPSLIGPYTRSIKYISKHRCADVGLILGGDDWEYPFWVLRNDSTPQPIRIEHVNVKNISAKYNTYPFNAFSPCAVIIVNNDLPNEIKIGNIIYLQKMISNPIGVYMQK